MANKKKKRKSYTKNEIADARSQGDTSVIHSLAVKLLKGESMTLAETQAAAALVGALRPEGSISRVSLAAIPAAQDYIFITLFLAYFGDAVNLII